MRKEIQVEDSSRRAATREARNPSRRLDPETLTVHGAMERIPGAAAIFRRFGIDACCGGELPLTAAAERHGVELERLLRELDAAKAAAGDDG